MCIISMGQQIPTTSFWDVAPCSLVEATDVLEVRTAFIIRAYHRSDNGGSTHLLNIDLLQRDCMALYPTRL
jgi:hypothetical protein